MTDVAVKMLSATVLEQLAGTVDQNLELYKSGSFTDLAKETGWAIESVLAKWDPEIVAGLDPSGTPEAEVKNSFLIYSGLNGMTPALAREERLWARLCHIECLEYARSRWLTNTENVAGAVRTHFFAKGLGGCRDDNAIGRLWWNGHLASLAEPANLELGLQRLLARANIRLQIMDRSDTAFRQPLVSGIFRMLGYEPWFNTYDAAIADFMFEVNKRSGGIMFEAFDEAKIDLHLSECLQFAKLRGAKQSK